MPSEYKGIPIFPKTKGSAVLINTSTYNNTPLD